MIIQEKAKAKLNLALKIKGKSGAYHLLDGAAVTVNLFDRLIIKTRRDKKIILKTRGLSLEQQCYYVPEKDNAFKAAKLFSEKTGTNGVEITLYKNIPMSGGMGGSSADAAAVLRGMERLYKTGENLENLANELGSDTAYLLSGGACRLEGRGEKLNPFELKSDLYFSVCFLKAGVDTSECFKKFDELNAENDESAENFAAEKTNEYEDNGLIDRLIASLEKGEPDYSLFENDLYPAAKSILPEIENALEFYKSLSPKVCLMTGSGSTVYAVFETKELCDWATDKVRKNGLKALTLKTEV